MRYIDIQIHNGEEYVFTQAIKVRLCLQGDFFFVWHSEFWGQSAIIEQKTGAIICILDWADKFRFHWLRQKEDKLFEGIVFSQETEIRLRTLFFVSENIGYCNKILKERGITNLDEFIANYKDKHPIVIVSSVEEGIDWKEAGEVLEQTLLKHAKSKSQFEKML